MEKISLDQCKKKMEKPKDGTKKDIIIYSLNTKSENSLNVAVSRKNKTIPKK
jgi:hypothetical protein